MSDLPIALVVAVAQNNVIGADGDMPWKLSSDLKRFKRDTMGKPIIMGRKTFDSIGKALPGRLNIVISRSDFTAEGIVHAKSIESAIFIANGWASEQGASEICVIGGGQIYEHTLQLASKLYVTHIMVEPEGDTHFPQISDKLWKEVECQEIPKGEKDSAETRYCVYERVG